MVTAQKLVAENLQTALAMIYFTLGLSNALGHEFPAGMFRALSAFPGAHWFASPPYANGNNRVVILSVCALMVVNAMATYSREQLLALLVLWTLQSVLCSRTGWMNLFGPTESLSPETGTETGRTSAVEDFTRSTRFLFWALWILLCVQIYCVFYVLVRKKAKQLREESRRQQEVAPTPPNARNRNRSTRGQ